MHEWADETLSLNVYITISLAALLNRATGVGVFVC